VDWSVQRPDAAHEAGGRGTTSTGHGGAVGQPWPAVVWDFAATMCALRAGAPRHRFISPAQTWIRATRTAAFRNLGACNLTWSIRPCKPEMQAGSALIQAPQTPRSRSGQRAGSAMTRAHTGRTGPGFDGALGCFGRALFPQDAANSRPGRFAEHAGLWRELSEPMPALP